MVEECKKASELYRLWDDLYHEEIPFQFFKSAKRSQFARILELKRKVNELASKKLLEWETEARVLDAR